MSPTACSVAARVVGEPLAGSSPVAVAWVGVEQPGPWGADAVSGSGLDEGVAAELVARSAETGVRVVLVRRPGRASEVGSGRRVLVACTVPGATWLRSAVVAEAKEVLDLDFGRVAAGVHGGFGVGLSRPVLLVCTNGRRDVCCAVRGRPVAAGLGAEFGERVWEASHLGGHRFAPTGVVLPSGYAYGGLDVGLGRELLVGGSVVVDGRCRGRSTWGAVGQVAELAVRRLTNTVDPGVLRVREPEADEDGGWRVVVWHEDGRGWKVWVVSRAVPARPASCGAVAVPTTVYEVERID
ncbi:sucrase ferredoxin [Actinokineospora pegani]|uniref:sucrase ferredoxin n=1 Tax=Actinokineospora pegani TaxID=2654637 RepID=UPI0022A7A608|nr:sucrase ferredoxin [Actinokineospora pegani]